MYRQSADSLLLRCEKFVHTTVKSFGQVVQHSLGIPAGSDKEMTLTRARKQVRRLLQVADRLLTAAGGRTFSNGVSIKICDAAHESLLFRRLHPKAVPTYCFVSCEGRYQAQQDTQTPVLGRALKPAARSG